MPRRTPAVDPDLIRRYLTHLKEQERAAATLQKYSHDLLALCSFLRTRPLTKAALIDWKQALVGQYTPASVNSMLAVVNGYLRFMGWQELCVKLLKVQKALFLDERRELTRAEYARLVHTAQRQQNERLAMVLQTICATGIRVSELRFITAEAVQAGRVEICSKGKRRMVFLPGRLRQLLKAYLRKQKKDRRCSVYHAHGQAFG